MLSDCLSLRNKCSPSLCSPLSLLLLLFSHLVLSLLSALRLLISLVTTCLFILPLLTLPPFPSVLTSPFCFHTSSFCPSRHPFLLLSSFVPCLFSPRLTQMAEWGEVNCWRAGRMEHGCDVLLTVMCATAYKDGRHESSLKAKPKYIDRPLVSGCGLGHKPLPLRVFRKEKEKRSLQLITR